MKNNYNVLVTGVGAIVGYGIVWGLKKSKYHVNVIGTDIYPDAVGQNWTDVFIQSLPACDDDYIDFLSDVSGKHDIDLIIFGTEQEMYKLSDNTERFGAGKTKLLLNRKELISISHDKWVTFEYIKRHNFHAIDSLLDCSFIEARNRFGIPFLIKPRCSYASKGVQKIYEEDEFNLAKGRNGSNLIIQKIVGDDEHEYTASVFGFGDGSYVGPIVFKRRLSPEGATSKATSFYDENIFSEIDNLSKLFKPIGPTNYQFRLHEGRYLLLEVNPRISSSSSMRTALGYNEPEMCIDYFINGEKPALRNIKNGYIVRYIEDMVSIIS